MAMVKTAISLPEDVFQGFNELARQSGRSRSGVMTEALAKYLHDIESLQILQGIEDAYADETPEEEAEELRFLNHLARLTIDTLNANGDVWEPDR